VSLTVSQIRAIAPNVAADLFLWRPTRSEPPLASRHDLRTIYNIDDLFDMHEVLDLEDHLAAKAAEDAKRPAR